jgi:caa(3)-type oxidase subunit IV
MPRAQIVRYLATWLLLLVLLGANAGIAYAPLGSANIAIELAIAGTMAGLSVAIFMEPGRENPLGWVFCFAGLFWLLIMLGLDGTDYFFRAQNLVH